jgi:hypothetical protein
MLTSWHLNGRYITTRNITIEVLARCTIYATLQVDGWHGEWLLRHCSCIYMRTLTAAQKGVYKRVLLASSTAEVADQFILRLLVCATAGVGSYIKAA